MLRFPNVPDVPGVPPLLRNQSSAFDIPPDFLPPDDQPALLSNDASGVSDASPAPAWGIYQDGNPVIMADSCVSLEFRKGWQVSSYQIEGGKFEDYDKVEEPFEGVVRMSAGGSENNREGFLQSIEAIAGDTNLYDIVMPERTYQSANIISYDFRRTNSQGVGLMQVDIRLEEIRMTAEAAFSTTKQPGGATQKNDGTVQTKAPTAQQESALSSLLH